MKKIITLLFCFITVFASAQYNTIAIQDFDTVQTPSWSYTGTGITYLNGYSTSSAGPASSPFGINGSWAWETTQQSSPDTLTFSNINISNYDSVYIIMRIAAFSPTSTSGGPDAGDYVLIKVSVDNGTTYYNRIKITGNNNDYWAYSATAVAIDTFITGNTSITFAPPTAGGLQTTYGYSTAIIRIPSTYTQVRIKILSRESTATERWCIDNVTLKGIPHNQLPTITTKAITAITAYTATTGGNVTSAGSSTVTNRGVCWDTLQNPTISNNTTSNGSGTGNFNSYLTGLTPTTKYHVRAYATSSQGTAYGSDDSFTTLTPSAPTVITAGKINLYADSVYYRGNVSSDGNVTVTDRGLCWGTSANPTTSSNKVNVGSGQGIFNGMITSLTPNTTYHIRAYAINSIGTSYGGDSIFTTLPISIPAIAVGNIISILGSSVIASGVILSDGNRVVTQKGFCWSTSPNPTIALTTVSTLGGGKGALIDTIRGLTPNTTYHLRSYATNSIGTGYSSDTTFLTATPPTIVIDKIFSVYQYSADINANVLSDGRQTVTTRGVCWSTSINPTIKNASFKASGIGAGSFVVSITGLINNTTYHVRAYAINAVDTSYSADSTFKTLKTYAPTVITSSPNTVTSKGAKCGGNVTADGGAAVILRGVCWSINPNPKANLGTRSVNGSGLGSYTYIISTLARGTTYHVRAFAMNSIDTGYGSDLTFKTQDAPKITLDSIKTIDASKLNCISTVTSDGDTAVKNRGICWDTKPGPKAKLATATSDGTGIGTFTSDVNPLLYGITYYIRAFAINAVDTAYSTEFTYIPIVVNTTSPITSITGYSAKGGGNVVSGNNITERGVIWDLNANPTIALSTKTSDGSGTGSYTSNITGLTSNMLYHVRAYATNNYGTAYGSDVSFTSVDKLTVTTESINITSSSTATCEGVVTSDGGLNVTNRGISWSDISGYELLLQNKTSDGTGSGSFTGTLTGLTTNTVYFLRAYAINNVDTAFGVQKTFMITPPLVITGTTTSISKTSATLNGNVNAMGKSTSFYFEYGTTASYGLTSGTDTLSNNKSVSVALTGLIHTTTYHYRLVAESSHGKTYGIDSVFTTLNNSSIKDKPSISEAIISTSYNQLKVEIIVQGWKEAEVVVTDISGKEFIRQKNFGNIFIADLPLAQAVYLVTLRIDNNSIIKKVMVE